MNIANEGEEAIPKDIPFHPDMPAFLILPTNDMNPGILRGAPQDEIWSGRISVSTQADFNERGLKTMGKGAFRFGFKMHAGVFGQLIAKTSHAFAVAHLGIDGFKPFLADFVRANDPPFDGYHLASIITPQKTEYLHEITLGTAFAQKFTVVGIALRPVYIVKWRLFGQLSSPIFVAVVGEPN